MIARIKKFRKENRFKTIVSLIALVASFLLVISFLIFSNWKIGKRRTELKAQIKQLQKEIQSLEEKNREFKKGISRSSEKEYVEEIARENLSLKKPGEEVVVVLPPEEIKTEPPKEEKSFFQKILDKLNFKLPKIW